jgi:hypothetical protein
MLNFACEALGELTDELVFVGGATTCLYVDLNIADEIRPTEDVDCVIEIASKKEYDSFQDKLRKKGFAHDTSNGAPICRFTFHNILVLDVMPNDEKILGFSNSWYKEGIQNKELRQLSDKKIYVFSLPYFLASKFEAYNGRGKNEPRLSSDLEDIVLVIDGIENFNLSVYQTSSNLKKFLSEMSNICLTDKFITEAIGGFLNNNQEKINRLNKRLRTFH